MLKTKKYFRTNDVHHNNTVHTPQQNSSLDLLTYEYEINDLRLSARNILTKGQTHEEIAQYSGASVSTRGRFISLAEKTSGTVHGRSLYLFIQASTKENIDLAIQKIEEIIQNDLTPSAQKMSKFMNRPPPVMSGQQPASTYVEKIMVGLDHAPAAFDLRGQLIGAGGANLHYIRNETGAIATLRGRGSLFIDPSLGTESPEPMHLYIEHPRYEGLQSAKQLAKNLIETLQQELMHYQQINPPVPTVQYASQPVVQQQPISQMSVPPPMLAVPPPIIQQNGLDHQPAIMQQQHFIAQNASSIVQPTQQNPQQQQPIIQQQAMLPVPQTLPIHLHPGNVVIQQQVQHAPSLGNVSIPPPGIHIPVKQGPVVHFQGPPPPVHLSQPPPNIQLQQPQTQIVLNQPPQNYQYQYIQQSQIQANDVTGQSNQVTIQHIYQPQHQLQGIVQQTAQPATQFNQFAQQTIRPQQLQPTQQYIVQGSTAYMMPPPNVIHQQQQLPQAQPQNIIFQTQQPPQIQQIPLQQVHQVQPQLNEVNNTSIMQNHNSNGGSSTTVDDTTNIKEENNKSSPEREESPIKSELKTEVDSVANSTTESNTNQQQLKQQIVPPPTTAQIPPPVMAIPPPISCVQHIVGNTLISTSQPSQTQTHQIYNQIPVSIQQIPNGPQQQIHVSTQNGQHFLVNAQQWPAQPTQFQQVPQNGNIQSFHLAAQPIRHPNEIIVNNPAIIGPTTTGTEFRPQTQQHILATAFNPHIQTQSVSGMQVQFQPIQQQQIVQSIPSTQSIIEQQSILSNMPPPTTFNGSGNINVTDSIKINSSAYQPGSSPQPVPFPQQKGNVIDVQMPRGGQKRKIEDDDSGPSIQPRMGMGSISGGKFINNQRDVQPPINISGNISSSQAVTTSTTTTSTSNAQDETNNGDNTYLNPSISSNAKPSTPNMIDQQQSPPSSSFCQQDNRTHYGRDQIDNGNGIGGGGGNTNNGGNNNGGGYQDGPPQRMLLDGPPGPPPPGPPRGPRYRANGHRDFSYLMRPPHMPPDGNFPMHRMNFGPPPPPPPTYPHRSDGGYGPPPPHFRSQW